MHTLPPYEGRLRGDNGAVVIEFAIVAPVLIYLFLAVMEYGVAFRDKNILGNGIRQSLRTNTNRGASSRWSEGDALLSFKAAVSQEKRLTVQRIVIFKATANSRTIPGPCLAVTTPTGYSGPGIPAGVPATCNVYGKDQLDRLTVANEPTYFDGAAAATCSSGSWDTNWCPVEDRDDRQRFASYVGMEVTTSYQTMTKLLPASLTITDIAFMRIEPND